ncbi:GntR family transcriptional regulator [Dactylosporangium fulvum]|uniref:GntR family transcriptional regulator n=1 Tax=Dactylosporangium fulvum TaxID=53359 RepID=A0ABY5WBW1_9ACTN|nr:GntR family transcriptional regulator [Dactylosporangium fulvum]UWP86949.1 GntR family transcriptional regulator [Dactylosporangium fulvum]
MPRSETRAERIYVALRADILAGRLLPGQRLPFADLGARYGTSVGVLREALSRLVEQGLVQSEAQHGYRVTQVSEADLLDLTATRVDIETLCLRHAMAHGDLAWESRVVAAFHTLANTPELANEQPATVNEDWAAAHATFHAAVLEGCPSRRLRDFAGSLRDAAELYRRWSRHLGGENDRDILGEHTALRDAVLARDTERAERVLADHIQYTTRALLANAPEDLTPDREANATPRSTRA